MQSRQDRCNDAQLCLDDMDWKEFRSLLKDQNARTSMAALQFAAPYFRERRASLSSLDETELDQAHSKLQGEVNESTDGRHRSQSFTTLSWSSPFPRLGGVHSNQQNSRIKSADHHVSSKAPLKTSTTTTTRRPRSASMSHSSSSGDDNSGHDSLASLSSSSHHSSQRRAGGKAQRRFSLPTPFQKQAAAAVSTSDHVVERMRNKFHDSLTSLQMSFQKNNNLTEEEEEESSWSSRNQMSAVACGKLEVDFPQGGRRRRSYSGSHAVAASSDDDESDDASIDLYSAAAATNSSNISSSRTGHQPSLPGSVYQSEKESSALPRVPWEQFPSRKEALKKTDSARMLMDGLLVMAPDQEGSIRDLLELKRSGSSSSGSFGCE